MLLDHRWVFNEIQNKGGDYIYREGGSTNCLINKSVFLFQKIFYDCVRQWYKTNGTIKRYNRLKRERRKEKKKNEKKKEKKKEKDR